MTSYRSWVILASLLAAFAAAAQDTEIVPGAQQNLANGPGVGARAMGMAGAFTAIADDATAATWNPAGLSQLNRPEASVVYDFFEADVAISDFEYVNAWTDGYVESSLDQTTAYEYDTATFLSGTYPFSVGNRTLVTQVSARKVGQFPDSTSQRDAYDRTFVGDLESVSESTQTVSGGITSYSLSVAIDAVPDKLRLGMSVNYLDADITRRTSRTSLWRTCSGYYDEVTGGCPFLWESSETETEKFADWTFDLGVQWHITKKWTFGAVYHTGFTTDYDYDGDTMPFDIEGQVTWPDGYALGLAFRPLKVLTLSVDYSASNWSDGVIEDNDSDLSWNFPNRLFANQQDTDAWRIGGEWVFLSGNLTVPVRAGYFMEDQISGAFEREGDFEGPFTNDAEEVKGYTLGSGIGVTGPNFSFYFDLAWVHSEADDSVDYNYVVPNDPFETTESFKANVDFSSDRIIVSAIFRF